MASFWLFLPVALSGLLTAGGFKIIQHGASEENLDVRHFPANMDQWKKDEAAERARQLFRQKRRVVIKVTDVTSPWLIDITSESPLTLVSDTTRPKIKEDIKSLQMVTRSWMLLNNTPAASSQNVLDSVFSTATHNFHTPKSSLNLKAKRPIKTATSGSLLRQKWLDEIGSTEAAQTLVEDFSTATQKDSFDSARPTLKSKGKPNLVKDLPGSTEVQKRLDEIESSASSQTLVKDVVSAVTPVQKLDTSSGSSTTIAQKKSLSPSGTNPLLGRCLLAILLLALVACIFIVSTGVLATVLWRQKKAYRLGQANHTEMVCISSLLAAEEEKEKEEKERRHSKVRREKLLGETGSETEADNLTLNSFLPEH